MVTIVLLVYAVLVTGLLLWQRAKTRHAYDLAGYWWARWRRKGTR